jgi:hypothetical protein
MTFVPFRTAIIFFCITDWPNNQKPVIREAVDDSAIPPFIAVQGRHMVRGPLKNLSQFFQKL